MATRYAVFTRAMSLKTGKALPLTHALYTYTPTRAVAEATVHQLQQEGYYAWIEARTY